MGGVADEVDTWNRHGIGYKVFIEAHPMYAEAINRRHGKNAKCFNVAISNKDGVGTLYINTQAESHSLFKMYENRHPTVKWMETVATMDVELRRLDTLLEENEIDASEYNLLFIDTQGNEHHVIEGAVETLKHMDFVGVEISEQKVYNGAMLYDEFVELMVSYGFSVHTVFPLVINNVHLGNDVLFIKNETKEQTNG